MRSTTDSKRKCLHNSTKTDSWELMQTSSVPHSYHVTRGDGPPKKEEREKRKTWKDMVAKKITWSGLVWFACRPYAPRKNKKTLVQPIDLHGPSMHRVAVRKCRRCKISRRQNPSPAPSPFCTGDGDNYSLLRSITADAPSIRRSLPESSFLL